MSNESVRFPSHDKMPANWIDMTVASAHSIRVQAQKTRIEL